MHDNDADGNAFFKCDFCQVPWDQERPMVEGHRGSLICGNCLSLAYREVVAGESGVGPEAGVGCALCLQTNDVTHWQSPVDESVVVCHECIARSAKLLDKDADFAWSIPS